MSQLDFGDSQVSWKCRRRCYDFFLFTYGVSGAGLSERRRMTNSPFPAEENCAQRQSAATANAASDSADDECIDEGTSERVTRGVFSHALDRSGWEHRTAWSWAASVPSGAR